MPPTRCPSMLDRGEGSPSLKSRGRWPFSAGPALPPVPGQSSAHQARARAASSPCELQEGLPGRRDRRCLPAMPPWVRLISSDLSSKAGLGSASTWMGDLLGRAGAVDRLCFLIYVFVISRSDRPAWIDAATHSDLTLSRGEKRKRPRGRFGC